jgi:hypothetical protein
MKRTMVILATLLASAGIAHAQTSTTPPSPGTTTTTPGTTTTTPGAAAVSLSSARSKIEASGYSNVTNLKQDSAGQWTAQATKSGKQVAVMVDSKGMVREAQQ